MNENDAASYPVLPRRYPDLGPFGDLARLATITLTVLLVALSWYLLKELVFLLRPLFLAGFLAYIIVPMQSQIRKHSHSFFARFALLAFVGLVLTLLYLIVYRNILELSNSLPELEEKAKALFQNLPDFIRSHLPGTGDGDDAGPGKAVRDYASGLINYTTGFFLEAIEVCFYLIFILIEAGRLPERIRVSFPDERATKILEVIASINQAMADFLRVKVWASLILAVPISLVLWFMGIKFVSLWGVLFFLGNFIPYFGSFGAWCLVSAYCFLQLGFGWQALTLTAMLLLMRTLSADLLEPRITCKAINVSPLVILLSLSFWSLCWGPVGMVLAVPLAVMLKIIMQHLPGSKPFADLMAEE